MAIYTKTGDKGTTSLFDGARVKKYELRVDTYGTFDELNAYISLCEKYVRCEANKAWLTRIQQSLFYLGAELATESANQSSNIIRITVADIHAIEKAIDEYLAELPEIKQFIFLGKSKAASYLHVARTVTRRAERLLVKLGEQVPIRKEVFQYANRLSDFLYAIARREDFHYQLAKITKEVMKRYYEEVSINKQADPELNLTFCQQIAAAVEKLALKEDVPVTMAVVNQYGELFFYYPMKGALLVSQRLAQKKAYTAVAMKAATDELAQLVQPGKALYQIETMTNGEIVTFGGGVPIYSNTGAIIGGLGISGGTVEQDVKIAKEALLNIATG